MFDTPIGSLNFWGRKMMETAIKNSALIFYCFYALAIFCQHILFFSFLHLDCVFCFDFHLSKQRLAAIGVNCFVYQRGRRNSWFERDTVEQCGPT